MDEKSPTIFLSFPHSGSSFLTAFLRSAGMNIPPSTPEFTKVCDYYVKEILQLTTPDMFYHSIGTTQFMKTIYETLAPSDIANAIRTDFNAVERSSCHGFFEPRSLLFLNAILAVYPKANLILFIRHPGDCIRSIQESTPNRSVDPSLIATAWLCAHEVVFPYLSNRRTHIFRTQRLVNEPQLLPQYIRLLGQQGLQDFVGFAPTDEHIFNCATIIDKDDWHHSTENMYCGERVEELWTNLCLAAVEKLP